MDERADQKGNHGPSGFRKRGNSPLFRKPYQQSVSITPKIANKTSAWVGRPREGFTSSMRQALEDRRHGKSGD